MSRPKIILTNDDGIEAEGIKRLWDILHKSNIADLYLIAPSHERSGMGAAITWNRPMLVRQVPWPNNTKAWSVDGTPADCIKLGTKVIIDFVPNLVVSGINAGSNAGGNVLHSGTVGAVIEATLQGIPGIALSCENVENPNFDVAEKYVAKIIQYILSHPLPGGSFLNINFPQLSVDEVKGFRLTRQGRRRGEAAPFLHKETEHGPSYWVGTKPEKYCEEYDCDTILLQQGYVTAVPIFINELTNHQELEKRAESFNRLF